MTSVDYSQFADVDELDLDAIDQIMAGGSEKGKYEEDVVAFATSGKLGVPYPFSGKKAQSVKTGLESAKDTVAKNDKNKYDDETKAAVANIAVRVRKVGEGDDAQELVFLIREDLRRARKSGTAAE